MTQQLKTTLKTAIAHKADFPFAVYHSFKPQHILDVPIEHPMLIVVLNGQKELGLTPTVICQANQFICLAPSPAVTLRNIPDAENYMALIIEFYPNDYLGLNTESMHSKQSYCVGDVNDMLEQCLVQFITASLWAPKALWSHRKREILMLLTQLGYQEVLSLLNKKTLKNQIHHLYLKYNFTEITTKALCEHLAMSESTLRRKLTLEQTTLQDIKTNARLGLALHLLQTSKQPISQVAQKCGYQSQSRFNSIFKTRFGVTPSELRKTQLKE